MDRTFLFWLEFLVRESVFIYRDIREIDSFRHRHLFSSLKIQLYPYHLKKINRWENGIKEEKYKKQGFIASISWIDSLDSQREFLHLSFLFVSLSRSLSHSHQKVLHSSKLFFELACYSYILYFLAHWPLFYVYQLHLSQHQGMQSFYIDFFLRLYKWENPPIKMSQMANVEWNYIL